MQKEGNEFGATTGRPRRCGWLDLPALKYAVMINGVTQLFMMKVDVLSAFKEIKVCTHYELEDATRVDRFPYEIANCQFKPVFKTFQGWNTSLENIYDFEDLPVALLDYISFLEKALNTPVNIVSVGPDRTQTIIRNRVLGEGVEVPV